MFKPNKKSLHYKMVEFYANTSYLPLPKDFCTYWRYFIWACFIFAGWGLVLFSIPFLLYAALQLIFLIPTMTMTHVFLLLKGLGIVILGLVVIIFLSYMLALLVDYIQINSKSKPEPAKKQTTKKQPSIFVVKYRSWKEKTCPLVDYSE